MLSLRVPFLLLALFLAAVTDTASAAAFANVPSPWLTTLRANLQASPASSSSGSSASSPSSSSPVSATARSKSASSIANHNSIPRRNRSFTTNMISASALRMSKVAVLGAGGGIGQPLSMLMKVRSKQKEAKKKFEIAIFEEDFTTRDALCCCCSYCSSVRTEAVCSM
jgi:hypothetical protein